MDKVISLPTVSVIIPTYQYGHTILRAIESIENQTYPLKLIQVIIVDDGSFDGTEDVIKKHPTKLNLIYQYQENKGKSHATKEAINLSSGKYIFNLDADDWFKSEKISKVVSIFESDEEINHVGHAATIYYEFENERNQDENIPSELVNKSIIGNELLREFYKRRIFFGGGSTFAARASQLKKHTINKEVNMYIDEFLLLISLRSGKSYLFKESLSYWFVHGNNYSVREGSESKETNLLLSSKAILDWVKANYFDLIDYYEMVHYTRYISFKEKYENKGIREYMIIFKLIFNHKISLKTKVKYRIFNRVLPYSLIKTVKLWIKRN